MMSCISHIRQSIVKGTLNMSESDLDGADRAMRDLVFRFLRLGSGFLLFRRRPPIRYSPFCQGFLAVRILPSVSISRLT